MIPRPATWRTRYAALAVLRSAHRDPPPWRDNLALAIAILLVAFFLVGGGE